VVREGDQLWTRGRTNIGLQIYKMRVREILGPSGGLPCVEGKGRDNEASSKRGKAVKTHPEG